MAVITFDVLLRIVENNEPTSIPVGNRIAENIITHESNVEIADNIVSPVVNRVRTERYVVVVYYLVWVIVFMYL